MIKVLDHGFVRLVSYMRPAEQELIRGIWSGDLEIVRNARVSYDADWRTGEDEGKDSRLIHRMMEGHHSSPFESMVFTFEVKAPIFVLRQWHRHRTWSYNEVSARYAELPEEYYVPEAEKITTQHATDKQMRTEQIHGHSRAWQAMMQDHNYDAFSLYKRMLADGVPRELARTVLPLATYSRMFATVDLHNLFHFLRLRLDPHAQYEIRVYAQALLELVGPICPVAVEAFQAELIHQDRP